MKIEFHHSQILFTFSTLKVYMLDIIILIFLSFQIRDLAKQKGLAPRTWVIRNILAWLCGEMIGLSIGMYFFGIEKPFMLVLTALPFAIAGYHIVKTQLDRKPNLYQDEINQLGDELNN